MSKKCREHTHLLKVIYQVLSTCIHYVGCHKDGRITNKCKQDFSCSGTGNLGKIKQSHTKELSININAKVEIRWGMNVQEGMCGVDKS